MTDRLITHLRHVDLAVPDYAAQLEFYTRMWGLDAETTDDGIAFLAAAGSPEQNSVRLRKADEKRLDLHTGKEFRVREFRVTRERGRNWLLSPFVEEGGGSVIDWMPVGRRRKA